MPMKSKSFFSTPSTSPLKPLIETGIGFGKPRSSTSRVTERRSPDQPVNGRRNSAANVDRARTLLRASNHENRGHIRQSQGDCSFQPRVGAPAPTLGAPGFFINPNGVASTRAPRHATLSGLRMFRPYDPG